MLGASSVTRRSSAGFAFWWPIRQASSIVTVSESARRDLLRFHGVPSDRVSVVHEAASPVFRPIADRARLDAVRSRYGLPSRFILYVGTIEPRKNLPRLMEAFANARRAGVEHQLVCVGPYGWSSRDLYEQIDRLGLRRLVHFTGYVPTDDLPVIYNLAEFFVTLVISATFLFTVGLSLWPVIAGLIVGGVIAAPFAAMATKHIPDRVLMLIVGCVVTLLSLRTIVMAFAPG